MTLTYKVGNITYPPTTSGSVLSNGTNGITGSTLTSTWAMPNSNFHSSNGKPVMTIPYGENTVVLEEKATLEVKGIVKINGVDLDKRLSTMEQVLNIPTRDVTMESKYPKLATLYQQYMHELEKYKTFERLKGDEKTTTS
jgi:hypothetical protein